MPERNLTDADVDAIVIKLSNLGHTCRFPDVDPKTLAASVEAYTHFNDIMRESGSVFRKTIIVFGVTGTIGLIATGVWYKLKTFNMGP